MNVTSKMKFFWYKKNLNFIVKLSKNVKALLTMIVYLSMAHGAWKLGKN